MSAVTLRASRGPDGYAEAGVYVAGEFRGVVTHPCKGAKWFAHRVGSVSSRGVPYRTRKEAIAAVAE